MTKKRDTKRFIWSPGELRKVKSAPKKPKKPRNQ